ncbi:uncharacterized protein SCHCODRAFT_02075142 [Schizophyllum commune H4-8]|uniref:uncharacterized protein n=1 Tax=Schizophyllum commune (strain H4-8 / FGSC 9210) TaxID=578458 RepID=UPI0021609375|nr:uncharacterized protein SCHCODRAFT_02075142 [Schizophyllum commune H4-8]KAI5887921.1 hypothetical protein SCHCODRAFT_02075142 [Schizophyllum commune H4-8]
MWREDHCSQWRRRLLPGKVLAVIPQKRRPSAHPQRVYTIICCDVARQSPGLVAGGWIWVIRCGIPGACCLLLLMDFGESYPALF